MEKTGPKNDIIKRFFKRAYEYPTELLMYKSAVAFGCDIISQKLKKEIAHVH